MKPGRRQALGLLASGLMPRAAPAHAQLPTALFSRAAPGGPLPAPWREATLPDITPNRHRIVDDHGVPVLELVSQRSASSVVAYFEAPLQATRLAWRWRTDAWPHAARASAADVREGDDFSLRLYLFYDYPLARLSLGDRALLSIARALRDPRLPAAALCYVADPRGRVAAVWSSPFTGRVRLMRLRADRSPGPWWAEDRDLHADFQRAFGEEHGPGMPGLIGVALAADTDQAGGEVHSRFADLRWGSGS
jgi:hypothetical protein